MAMNNIEKLWLIVYTKLDYESMVVPLLKYDDTKICK